MGVCSGGGLNQVVGLQQVLAQQLNSQGRRDSLITAQLGRTEAQIFADLKAAGDS